MSENKLQSIQEERDRLNIELEALRSRLIELEDIECQRISEEQERFDALHVLDEYAQQLEETRDKLARLLRAGTAVQAAATIDEVVQRVADAVGEAGWGSASVYLLKDFAITHAAYYQTPTEDIAFFESTRRTPEQRARDFGPDFEQFKVSRSYFVPAEKSIELFSSTEICPGRREIAPGDNWDPMDLAYVPIYGSSGEVIGTINCDDPIDGNRPTQETFLYLELFADLAARKVEMVRLLEQQSRIEAALRQSEQKYRTMFDRSADSFFLMDELFRDCNQKACELWKCTKDDIVGHSPVEFSPEYQPDGQLSTIKARNYILSAMGGEPQIFDWVHKAKDGTLLYCEVSLAAVDIGGGNTILAIVRDNSDRKREADEKETMSITSQLFLSANGIESIYSQLPGILSDRYEMQTVVIELYDREQNLVRTMGSHGLKAEKRASQSDLSLTISNECILREEAVFKSIGFGSFTHKDPRFEGIEIHALISIPLKANQRVIGSLILADCKEHGELPRYKVTLQTIANNLAQYIDRYRADESRELLKTFYIRLLDNLPAQIAVLGPDCAYRFVNRAAVPDPVRRRWLIGKTDMDYCEEFHHNLDVAHYRQERIREACIKHSSVHYEEKLVDRQGKDRYFVRILNPVMNAEGDVDHVVGYGLDVTDRMNAELEMRKLTILPDENPSIILSFDGRNKLSYRNRAAEEFAMSIGVSDLMAILPPNHTLLMETSRVEAKTVEDIQERRDGRILHWQYKTVPSTGECNVYAVDITGTKAVGHHLTLEEQKVELVGPVLIVDAEGKIVEMTKSIERLLLDTGLKEPELVLPANYSELILNCLSKGEDQETEGVLNERIFRWRITPSQREGLVCFSATEVTELRRLEQELRHAQKMESIGRLTSGVAHDFNNLLTGIMGNLDLAQQASSDSMNQQAYVRLAAAATERAVSLVRQLLSYSRKRTPDNLEEVCVNKVCETVLSMLSRTIDRRIILRHESGCQGQCLARIDTNRLEQVLMNLCVNAADAVLDKIRSMHVREQSEEYSITLSTEIGTSPKGKGEFVILRVRDTGCGISNEAKQRLFDPYFTTKEINGGTGLGLSTVLEIVNEAKGSIEFVSEVDKGSEFTVYLPAAEKHQPRKSAETSFSRVAGGNETILLVDDEEVIRSMGQEVLEMYGYRVLLAGDGCEAMEVFEQESKSIDLVILDIHMPKMSGDEVLPLLLEKRAELKVILCSGYAQEQFTGKNINFGSIAFLNKPYRTVDLASAVRDVLDHKEISAEN